MARYELGSVATWIIEKLETEVIPDMRAEHKRMSKHVALQEVEAVLDCIERQSDRVEFISRVLFLLSHGQHKAAEEMLLSILKSSED